jgi:hypothetical protein
MLVFVWGTSISFIGSHSYHQPLSMSGEEDASGRSHASPGKAAAQGFQVLAGRIVSHRYLTARFVDDAWSSRTIEATGLPTDCVLHGLGKTAARILEELGHKTPRAHGSRHGPNGG